MFQKGASTEMLARFSTVAGESGSPNTWRDVRGFSFSMKKPMSGAVVHKTAIEDVELITHMAQRYGDSWPCIEAGA